MQHLVGVVQQTSLIGMVHGGGGRVFAIGFVQFLGKGLYDGHQGAVRTEGEQVGNGVVPHLAVYRARYKSV